MEGSCVSLGRGISVCSLVDKGSGCCGACAAIYRSAATNVFLAAALTGIDSSRMIALVRSSMVRSTVSLMPVLCCSMVAFMV